MLAFQHAILFRNQPGFGRAFRLENTHGAERARFPDLDGDVRYPPSGSTGGLEAE